MLQGEVDKAQVALPALCVKKTRYKIRKARAVTCGAEKNTTRVQMYG